MARCKERFICPRKARESDLADDRVAKGPPSVPGQRIHQLPRATPAKTPRMRIELRSFEVSDGNPTVFPARFVDVLCDRCPNASFCRIMGTDRLAPHSQY